jgi:hypothetical protein
MNKPEKRNKIMSRFRFPKSFAVLLAVLLLAGTFTVLQYQFLPVHATTMTTIFSDSFESGTELTNQTPAGAWDGNYLPDGTPGGSNTVQNTTVYDNFSYAANFTATNATQYGCVYKNLAGSYTALESSTMIYLSSNPVDAYVGTTLCYAYDAGAFFTLIETIGVNVYWGIEVVTDSGWQAYLESSPSNPSANTWYNITLYGQVGADATASLWVNGILKVSVSGISVTTRAPLSWVRDDFWLNTGESSPISCYSDDITVSANVLAASISPASATLDVGQSETFGSSVSGGLPPYSYQWCLNGAAVSGATNSSWTWTPSSAGSYTIYLNATDSAGYVATSNAASFTVNTALTCSIKPTNVTMNAGQSQTFTASVSGGTASYSYQWYLDGSSVGGATSSTWKYTPSSSSTHTVYCVVEDSATIPYNVESNTASVNVNSALSISISPTSATLDVGQSQLFTSSVLGGTSPYSYQWYLNGVSVSGATSPTWTFTAASAGSYTVYVNVTDATSAVATSATVPVTVNGQLSATILPGSATLDVGQSKLFTSTVSGGTPTYSYQWCLNGSPVSGATGTTWTFTPASAGSYTVYLNVTDSVNAVTTSNNAPVTVNGQLSITITPTIVAVDMGQSQLFTSTVSGGTSSFTYQWCLNGSKMPGATGSTWNFTPSSNGSYNIYVNVTDSAGYTAESNVASTVVNPSLSVSVSPTSVLMDVGQSTLFTSTISGGTSPYAYQWYLNGAPVSGATSSSWTFSPTSQGSYTVYVVVNDSAATSAGAQSGTVDVAVDPQLTVTASPPTSTIYLGQSQTYTSSVGDTGTSPYVYQWYLNGNPVSGATNQTWIFTPAKTGTYQIYAKVTDDVNAVAQSPTVQLTVYAEPQMVVTINSTSAVIDTGQSVFFTSSEAGGTSPFTYQWYLNGIAVSGATSSSWNFMPLSTGTYQVYLDVKDSLNIEAESKAAFVTVNALAIGGGGGSSVPLCD